jgi:hypothetical protein
VVEIKYCAKCAVLDWREPVGAKHCQEKRPGDEECMSFDQLVGEAEQRERYGEPERLSGLRLMAINGIGGGCACNRAPSRYITKPRDKFSPSHGTAQSQGKCSGSRITECVEVAFEKTARG